MAARPRPSPASLAFTLASLEDGPGPGIGKGAYVPPARRDGDCSRPRIQECRKLNAWRA